MENPELTANHQEWLWQHACRALIRGRSPARTGWLLFYQLAVHTELFTESFRTWIRREESRRQRQREPASFQLPALPDRSAVLSWVGRQPHLPDSIWDVFCEGLPVWTGREAWVELGAHPEAPDGLFDQAIKNLYRENDRTGLELLLTRREGQIPDEGWRFLCQRADASLVAQQCRRGASVEHRRQALQALIQRFPARALELLEEVCRSPETDPVPGREELDAPLLAPLLAHPKQALRQRAFELLRVLSTPTPRTVPTAGR